MSIDWSAGLYRCPDSEMGAQPLVDFCWHFRSPHEPCQRESDIPDHIVIDTQESLPLCPLYICHQHVLAALAVMAQKVNPRNPMAIADNLVELLQELRTQFIRARLDWLFPATSAHFRVEQPLAKLLAPPKD